MPYKDRAVQIQYLRDHYMNNKEQYRSNSLARRIRNPVKELLNRIRGRAKEKGQEFDLTEEYIHSIWPKDGKCPYLKVELIFQNNNGKNTASPDSVSVDRIDNTKGYVQGNIEIVSFLYNSMKRNATPEQLALSSLKNLRIYSSYLPEYKRLGLDLIEVVHGLLLKLKGAV